jgi:uncharacterized membrane protein
LALWPTWLSYPVSYLFIGIVWANHHYLMRYASEASPRRLWFSFAHLFSMSLLPLATAWMAVSELAPQPVAFYAAVFLRHLYRADLGAHRPDARRGQERTSKIMLNGVSVARRKRLKPASVAT